MSRFSQAPHLQLVLVIITAQHLKCPPSYVNAIKLIEEGKYQEATPLLNLADSKKPKDADIDNLL